jgi:hypothetical protein
MSQIVRDCSFDNLTFYIVNGDVIYATTSSWMKALNRAVDVITLADLFSDLKSLTQHSPLRAQ